MKKTINSTLVMRLWVCILAAIGFASCSDDKNYDITTSEVYDVITFTVSPDDYVIEKNLYPAYWYDFNEVLYSTYFGHRNKSYIEWYDFEVLINGEIAERSRYILTGATNGYWKWYIDDAENIKGIIIVNNSYQELTVQVTITKYKRMYKF